ncbi:tRNA methyltransferase [Sulfolobus sp. F3]|nr:tRNA methyltransferase [Sulfolobus sp. F3]
MQKVLDTWGGSSYFIIKEVNSGKEVVKDWKSKGYGSVVHLTMYGINLINFDINELKFPLLIVVGSEKVEGWYYHNSHYNIAVGNQPHSEVSALAIFLDRIYKGRELYMEFRDAKLKILPQRAGKKVTKIG